MNKKYALCVGNNYPGTSAQLSGCVNDATDWAELLNGQGYNIELVLEATKAEVLTRLRNLVSVAGFADRVVFTYSGHGSWIPDRDGDEGDGRDEVLVMADYMQGGLLSDDELQQVFGELRYGVGALIVSDSCHSGTVNRFLPPNPQNLNAYPIPRFLPPTLFTDVTETQRRDLETRAASVPRKTASLISGCGDFEFSYDAWFGSRANGALTRAAIDSFEKGISLRRWHDKIREALPSRNYPQSPELTATPYRKYTRAI